MFTELGLDVRKEVLTYSLIIESTTGAFLGTLLGVKNSKNSISFGNKSSALSFNQKVNLLIDIGAFSKPETQKFTVLMEVRNQFVHNIEATTYEKCFSFLPGRDITLLKSYPQAENSPKEEQLRNAVRNLANDIAATIYKLDEKINEKIRKQVEAETSDAKLEATKHAIEHVESLMNEKFSKDLFNELDQKQIKITGTYIKKVFWSQLTKKYAELTGMKLPPKPKGEAK